MIYTAIYVSHLRQMGHAMTWLLHTPLHLGPLRPVLPVVPNGEPRR